MHLHHCRCFQVHVRMHLQSPRALCNAPGGAGSIWKYLEALARATGVPGRFAYGFRTELHFADVESQLLSRLPPELLPPNRPPLNTRPILLDHGLQVHLHTPSITASKCISKLARLRPPRPHYHGLPVHLQRCSITVSKCISKLARLWPQSVSPNLLSYGLLTHSITASKCISKFARLCTRSASVYPVDHAVLKRLSSNADSPSSTPRCTLHGIRSKFVRKSSSSSMIIGRG